MTDFRFEPTSRDDLAASATLQDERVVLVLSGTADHRDTDFLDDVLRRIHDDAMRIGVKEVAVDVRDLEFMNSTAFKSLLTWITSIVSLDAEKQYEIRFLSTAQHRWQKRSLDALRCFAVNLIHIDT